MVCRKVRNNSNTPLHYGKTGNGKYLHGNHFAHGYHGCKVTAKINKSFDSGDLRLAQLC